MTQAKQNKRQKIIILVAGALIMLCAGILYMWSVFQPYVTEYHGWSGAQISMTSSIMIAFFVLGNIVAGLVQEKVHPRITAIVGSILFSLGLYLTSIISSEIPVMLYLTYGIVGGFGCGLVYCAVLAVLQKWYAAKMGFITGISVGFFGLSVVVLSPLVEMMLRNIGVPDTFRTLALVFLAVLIASSLFIKKPSREYYYAEVTKTIKPENVKQFRPNEMLRSASYYYITIAMFASSSAYLVIVPFISTIAVMRGMSSSLALIVVMSTGVANAAGRILAPMLSDKIGRSKTIILCSLVSALGCLLIIPAKGLPYVAAVFLITLAYGGTGGTNPVITTELFGARYSGVNYGLVLVSIAFSSLIFGWVSGSLSAGGDFTGVFVICAFLCVMPIMMMLLLRKRCRRLGKVI